MCSSASFLSAQSKLLSPKEFLGYEPGDRFTPHDRTVAYFTHTAEVLPNAALYSYGKTYEQRPLVYLVISSPENFARLEEIRLNNLRRTGLLPGDPSPDDVAIVWLSYNVHGSEASSMEAAMETLYALADPANEEASEWLKSTLVIIDPCVNPDGRDRYANFHRQYPHFGDNVQPVQGFAGFKANQALNNSLLLGIEKKGEGEIIYFVDNPLFRSFSENGKMLFANAVFIAGE